MQNSNSTLKNQSSIAIKNAIKNHNKVTTVYPLEWPESEGQVTNTGRMIETS